MYSMSVDNADDFKLDRRTRRVWLDEQLVLGAAMLANDELDAVILFNSPHSGYLFALQILALEQLKHNVYLLRR